MGTILEGETKAELVVTNPPFGKSSNLVTAKNDVGIAQSEVAVLQVQQKIKVAPRVSIDTSSSERNKSGSHKRSAEQIEQQRVQIEAENEAEASARRSRRNRILLPVFAVILVLVAGTIAFIGKRYFLKSERQSPMAGLNGGQNGTTNLQASSPLVEVSSLITAHGQTNLPVNLPPPSAFPLPSGWREIIIGSVTNQYDEFTSSNFNLTAAAEGLRTNGDNISFVVNANLTNGFQAVFFAKKNNTPKSRCGIMIRASEDPAAAFVFVGASSEKIFMCCRATNGALISSEYELPRIRLRPK